MRGTGQRAVTRLRAVSALVTRQLLPLPSASAGDGVARPAGSLLPRLKLSCRATSAAGCEYLLRCFRSQRNRTDKQEYASAGWRESKAALSKTRPALTLLNQYREAEPGTKRLPRQEGCSQPRRWQKLSRASKRAARLILI